MKYLLITGQVLLLLISARATFADSQRNIVIVCTLAKSGLSPDQPPSENFKGAVFRNLFQEATTEASLATLWSGTESYHISPKKGVVKSRSDSVSLWNLFRQQGYKTYFFGNKSVLGEHSEREGEDHWDSFRPTGDGEFARLAEINLSMGEPDADQPLKNFVVIGIDQNASTDAQLQIQDLISHFGTLDHSEKGGSLFVVKVQIGSGLSGDSLSDPAIVDGQLRSQLECYYSDPMTPDGVEVQPLAGLHDLFPTICDIGRLNLEKVKPKLTGRSLLALVYGINLPWIDFPIATSTRSKGGSGVSTVRSRDHRAIQQDEGVWRVYRVLDKADRFEEVDEGKSAILNTMGIKTD